MQLLHMALPHRYQRGARPPPPPHQPPRRPSPGAGGIRSRRRYARLLRPPARAARRGESGETAAGPGTWQAYSGSNESPFASRAHGFRDEALSVLAFAGDWRFTRHVGRDGEELAVPGHPEIAREPGLASLDAVRSAK